MSKLTSVDYETLNEIFSRIDDGDIPLINTVIKRAYTNLQNRSRNVFRTGDLVEFTSRRTGAVIRGTITKINKKTITLRTATNQDWRVSPSMLRAVETA